MKKTRKAPVASTTSSAQKLRDVMRGHRIFDGTCTEPKHPGSAHEKLLADSTEKLKKRAGGR